MKQYFEEDVVLTNEPTIINYQDDELKLSFKTNTGMFSKNHVDDYSIKLVKAIPIKQYKSILDLGCGYGFIGIYLGILTNSPVTFIDITTRACEYAKINAQNNKLTNYQVIQSDGIENDELFDLIVLNPPIHAGKQVVYQLIDNALSHLMIDGALYLVINKKHGAKSLIKDYQDNVEVINSKKGIYILKLTMNT